MAVNSMCVSCGKYGKDCKGTECQTWTGCVMKKRPAPMDALKKYLTRKGIPFRGTEEWSLAFSGNHVDGILIDRDKVDGGLWSYLRKHWDELDWEFRKYYETVYIFPKA